MIADICLISEATFPYVAGGVATCIKQLIDLNSHLTFSILYLGASSKQSRSLKYSLPANVISVDHMWLFDPTPAEGARQSNLTQDEIQALIQFFEFFADTQGLGKNFDEKKLRESFDLLFNPASRRAQSVLRASGSQVFLELALQVYKKSAANLPFLQFFHQWRSRILPIIRLSSMEFPKAGMYYSTTTGHAGIAGVIGKFQTRRPFMLTEHGLYPRERRHDIWELPWMRMTGKDHDEKAILLATRGHWLRYFDRLSLIAYRFSDVITTLFEKYKEFQIELGAAADKCHVIANGMSTSLLGLRAKSPAWRGLDSKAEFRVSYIGRVTPIKDVKCLINAVIIARSRFPNIRCDIFGPIDHDHGYVESCRMNIRNSGSENCIEFHGLKPITQILEQTDLLCLSSLSEGQPMVILEAALAGIPVVATDVGGCRDLLMGDSPEDRELGPNGILCPIADPDSLADAIIKIGLSPELWANYATIGMQRASTYYDERRTAEHYLELFQFCLEM